MKTFILDNQAEYPATLEQIIEANDLVLEEIELIEALEIGGNCYVGMVEIKRLA